MKKIDFRLDLFEIGDAYSRKDMARLGGVPEPVGPRDPYWSTGIVLFNNVVLLLVTLDKEKYDYIDYFDGTLFWWQSQNQQTQQSPAVKLIESGVVPVLLFVRLRPKQEGKTAPFVYCGRLSVPELEGERPVTALFGLLDYVPNATGELGAVYHWKPEAERSADQTLDREREIVRRQSTGQGRQLDPALRRKVELHAMDLAKEHYTRSGWVVKDTSATKPYDLECTRDKETRRVEVKGTQSAGEKVLLTAGEVRAACDGGVATDLYIVHSIQVGATGARVVEGGRIRLIEQWLPEGADLTPVTFSYQVPLVDEA